MKITSKKTIDISDLTIQEVEAICLGLDELCEDVFYTKDHPDIVEIVKNINNTISNFLDSE